MLRARNLVYFSCNSQQNFFVAKRVAKRGCYTCSFVCNLSCNTIVLQVAENNCLVFWPYYCETVMQWIMRIMKNQYRQTSLTRTPKDRDVFLRWWCPYWCFFNPWSRKSASSYIMPNLGQYFVVFYEFLPPRRSCEVLLIERAKSYPPPLSL